MKLTCAAVAGAALGASTLGFIEFAQTHHWLSLAMGLANAVLAAINWRVSLGDQA